MRYLLLILLIVKLHGVTLNRPGPIAVSSLKHPWVVYYGEEIAKEEFEPYNPIVLQDSSSLVSALAKEKIVLGYLNLGEVETENRWFSSMKDKGLLIEENSEWPGSWTIDLRKSFWKKYLLNTLIPSILKKEFTGLFLDQLDRPLGLEERDPIQFKGMQNAATDLVKAIRKKFPKIKLMLNRAYVILPKVGHVIDYELAETLYTSYDFKTKSYFVRPKEDFEWGLSQLKMAQIAAPDLVLFSLDYWDPSDTEMIKKIYSVEVERGLRPYVSIISLDKIVPTP